MRQYKIQGILNSRVSQVWGSYATQNQQCAIFFFQLSGLGYEKLLAFLPPFNDFFYCHNGSRITAWRKRSWSQSVMHAVVMPPSWALWIELFQTYLSFSHRLVYRVSLIGIPVSDIASAEQPHKYRCHDNLQCNCGSNQERPMCQKSFWAGYGFNEERGVS